MRPTVTRDTFSFPTFYDSPLLLHCSTYFSIACCARCPKAEFTERKWTVLLYGCVKLFEIIVLKICFLNVCCGPKVHSVHEKQSAVSAFFYLKPSNRCIVLVYFSKDFLSSVLFWRSVKYCLRKACPSSTGSKKFSRPISKEFFFLDS